MTCQDFETLMADALGDELSSGDRATFEAHLAECEACRLEYESARRTVVAMRELPGPTRVKIRREGSRLVIDESDEADSDRREDRTGAAAGTGARRARGVPISSKQVPLAVRLSSGVFRYAASIMIAFVAGYAFHAGLLITDAMRTDVGVVQPVNVAPTGRQAGSFQRALVDAHQRNRGSSGLAKCLIAMAHGTR